MFKPGPEPVAFSGVCMAKRLTCGWGCLCVAAAAQLAWAAGAAPAPVRSAAPDWPQWRGPCRDGISAETGLLQAWPEGGPKLLWKASGIGKGYSSPIVAGDSVYVTGDQDKELAIRAFALDGRPRWAASNGAPWKGSYPGARASCAFDDGRLYQLNAHGRLACLDAATGGDVWSVNVLERFGGTNILWGISESVLVHGGLVFATPAGAQGLVVALDKRTGAPVWVTPAIEGERASYSSPLLIDAGARQLLANCGSRHAFAVDAATGALVWQLPHLDPKNTVNMTPVLAGPMLVFNNSSRDFGALFGVPLDGGGPSRAWTCELKVGHGGMVCLNGRLYGASGKGALTGWVSVDAKTGQVSQAAPAAALPDGSAVLADGRLYGLTSKGTMTLQEVTDAGFKVAGSFQLAEGKVQDAWAHPVVCKGRLFLRFHDTLFCYDVRRAGNAER